MVNQPSFFNSTEARIHNRPIQSIWFLINWSEVSVFSGMCETAINSFYFEWQSINLKVFALCRVNLLFRDFQANHRTAKHRKCNQCAIESQCRCFFGNVCLRLIESQHILFTINQFVGKYLHENGRYKHLQLCFVNVNTNIHYNSKHFRWEWGMPVIFITSKPYLDNTM